MNYSSSNPLILEDYSGYNQPFHPKVLRFSKGFAGYQYWMVTSPYPVGGLPYRDRWENPVIYRSQNGVHWEVVANPLDDITDDQIERGDYMSDPHLVYREDTGELECWYRHTINDNGVQMLTNMIKKTTKDGVNWSERIQLVDYKPYTDKDFMRSPAIMWDNELKLYKVWYQSNTGVWYSTSKDGCVWSEQMAIIRDVSHNTWHLDVEYFNNKFNLLSYSRDNTIKVYSSEDGINFEFICNILGTNATITRLYRSCSLLDEFGNIRVYFTEEVGGKAYIGLAVGLTFDSLKIIDGQNVLN